MWQLKKVYFQMKTITRTVWILSLISLFTDTASEIPTVLV